jgi:hypothetical protein
MELAEHDCDYLTTRTESERCQDQDETLFIEDKDFEADAHRRREAITKA